MIIILFFIAHWYVSLFFQSFFNHRYSAHQMFTMSPFWEKVFYIFSWITNGSSYLSPNAYGIMHRQHHAGADTKDDPHSPKFSKNLFDMMWITRGKYLDLVRGTANVDKKYLKNLPNWKWFEKFADHTATRAVWTLIYIGFYAMYADHWALWLLLPITIVMGPVHGAVINWFAHKYGYRNFEVGDTSMNLLPVDILMMGEGYHNNHHKFGNKPNFGYRWHEIDPVYPFILLFDVLGIIKLKKEKKPQWKLDIKFSKLEIDRVKNAFKGLNIPTGKFKLPEEQLQHCIENWERFVKNDWKQDLSDYVNELHVRKELQLFLENVDDKMRTRINSILEPMDKHFKEKMKPWDPKLLKGFKLPFEGNNFWETHSIFQAG